MAGWNTLRALAQEEFIQSKEEGRSAAAVDALWPQFEAAGKDEAKLLAINERLLALPVASRFNEPSDLPGIRTLRPANRPKFRLKLADDQLYDRMYGAWLGRCAGCALGKPVEPYMDAKGDMTSRQRTKTYLQAIDSSEYPIHDYIPGQSPAADQTGPTNSPLSTREKIAFMEDDDDIRYTVIGQKVMMEHGAAFTSWDVARQWMLELPYIAVCTAETQAFRNLVTRYEFHLTDARVEPDWTWVATNQNPYREWIGAQIRADSWGYAAPGNPELAADFAWRDARISHVKNGIYGEMFAAAMIAAAFAAKDMREAIEAGLGEIPATSRLYEDMQKTIGICGKHGNDPRRFEAVFDDLYALLGHYNPIHTINNAAVVVAALLLGGDDFEKVITIAVMGGWDTDCNGATAGSIYGAMHGAKQLPTKWTGRLHDTLNSKVIGYHPIAISQCAKRSAEIARKTAC